LPGSNPNTGELLPGGSATGRRILLFLAEHPIHPEDDPRPEQPAHAQASKADDVAQREGSQIEHKPKATDSIGTVVGRRYEIIEFLGAGRRGKVYVARDRLTEATVALKRFRTDTPKLKQAAELAMAAAEVVAGIRHEHIVRVFDLGEDPAGPYIISEYIDGPDAARLVASQGAMSLRQAAKIVETIGEAVSFAHERDLFHGSVRGSNILFAEGNKPMLCDFGIGEVDKGDVPRAIRQDVKSMVRTLCQLLTGVSSGSVEVRDLPESIQPAVRASLGTGVTTSQPTIAAFLRELRATELDIAAPPEDERTALGRGRKAELSGSFDAMREAGESALEKNGESAEAMVLLRRADQLKVERDELMNGFKECEQRLDYAGALDALTKLQKRFPADHQAQKLGPKRETLAELTRLTGIAEQLGAAGHTAASLDSWKRIAQLSPSDERAREMVRVAASAKLRKRLINATGAAVVVLAVGGAGGYFAWQNGLFGAVPGIPGLSENGAVEQSSQAEDATGEIGVAEDRQVQTLPAHRNPLVADRDESESLNDTDRADAGNAPVANISDESTRSPTTSARDERTVEFARAAALAKRDALSAKRHAEQLGASGLAAEEFGAAATSLASAEGMLAEGSYANATDRFDQARSGFVSAAARAGTAIADIHTSIENRRFREAATRIEKIEPFATNETLEALRAEMSAARTRVLEIVPGVSMHIQFVEPGVYTMGSPDDEDGRRFGEDINQVRIENGFWMARTELTRGQLAAIRGGPMPANPERPVVGITLDEARTVAELLTERFGGTFSVPTEMQWEYACRADRQNVYDKGWSVLDSAGLPNKPGKLGANPWGFVDMIGNAAELVITNQAGHNDGVVMTRGGSYLSTPSALRAAARHELVQRDRPDERVGVRLVWTGAQGE
jgi:formylglycine-generating enzyme required for sulfatase activity